MEEVPGFAMDSLGAEEMTALINAAAAKIGRLVVKDIADGAPVLPVIHALSDVLTDWIVQVAPSKENAAELWVEFFARKIRSNALKKLALRRQFR